MSLSSCKDDEPGPPPTFTAFAPSKGAVGSEVIITGTGFIPTKDGNTVKFNNTTAQVISATATSLTVQVPNTATTGLITVTSSGVTVTSATNYEVILEAIKAGGSGFDAGYSVAVDADGNAYVTGLFIGTATFGNTQLTSGTEEIFLAKYNPAMELVWVRQIGGSGQDEGYSVSADASGDVYVTGTFSGTAAFGSFQLISEGGTLDIFLAKVNSSGTVVWAKKAGSSVSYAESGASVKSDGAGNIYLTGHFAGTATFGATSLTSVGETDIFISKYDADTGDVIWAKQAGGSESDSGLEVTVNAAGYVYVVGSFFGTAEFGAISLTSEGSFDGFTAQYDTDGDIMWAKRVGGSSNDLMYSVDVDAAGNGYVTGYTSGSQLPFGMEDIVVTKYDRASGNVLWSKKFGGTDYDQGLSIDVDDAGNSYITGHFSGTAAFGDKSLVSVGNSRDAFVAKLNNSGDVQWARQAGSLNNDVGNSVALDNTGIVHTTGFFNNTSTFGTTPLTSTGADEIFLWKIRQEP